LASRGEGPAEARPAAGLVLLYPEGPDTLLLLTVRGAALTQHGGQVSLPGGAIEPGEDAEQTALREAEEEVGLAAGLAAVRGRLTPLHIPVSGYLLQPVVATCEARPVLRPRIGEVESLVEVPLARLASQGSWRVESRQREGATVQIPLLDLGGPRLWGATAMVVAELLAVLGVELDPW